MSDEDDGGLLNEDDEAEVVNGMMLIDSAASDWNRARLRTMSFENSRGQYRPSIMGFTKSGHSRLHTEVNEGRSRAAA